MCALVRQNPALTAPPPPPPMPQPVPVKEEEASTQWRLTKLPPFWLPITISNLSEQAFALGLRSKLVYDFTVRKFPRRSTFSAWVRRVHSPGAQGGSKGAKRDRSHARRGEHGEDPPFEGVSPISVS